jgi:hypothetical protein
MKKSKRKTNAQRKPATSTAIRFGNNDVPRHPKAARTRRWEAMRDYLKKHRGATLEQVIAATSYTRDDYRLDVKRGSLKA